VVSVTDPYGRNLGFLHHQSKNVEIKIHKTIILPTVLYGCKTLSLTLKKKYSQTEGV
jgi:hypothetical protein